MILKNNLPENAVFDESKLEIGNIQMSEGLDLSKTASYQHTTENFVNNSRFFLPIYQKTELCAWGAAK